jgi:hypothetical protein
MNEGGGKRAERRKEGGGKKERKCCALSAVSLYGLGHGSRTIPASSASSRTCVAPTRLEIPETGLGLDSARGTHRTSQCAPVDVPSTFDMPTTHATRPVLKQVLFALRTARISTPTHQAPPLAPNQALGTPPHQAQGTKKKKKQNGAPEPVPSTSERRTEGNRSRRGYEARDQKMTSRVCPPLQKRPESSFDNRGRQCCNHHGAPMDTLWHCRWLHGDTHAVEWLRSSVICFVYLTYRCGYMEEEGGAEEGGRGKLNGARCTVGRGAAKGKHQGQAGRPLLITLTSKLGN